MGIIEHADDTGMQHSIASGIAQATDPSRAAM